jgi:nucleoid DNA-binding protein
MSFSLVDQVASLLGCTKRDAHDAIGAVVEAVHTGIAQAGDGGKVAIPKLVTFTVQHKESRMARNPKTGEPVNVPAHYVVRAKPAASVKRSVN